MSEPKKSSFMNAMRNISADGLDDFPTPPWATRALCEYVLLNVERRDLKTLTAWEPAANRGYMVKPLEEYFGVVIASDIFDYGVGYDVHDFLKTEGENSVDWVITNPPFNKAEEFTKVAMRMAKSGVAILARLQWIETLGRYERLFSKTPPAILAPFAERVNMTKGKYDPRLTGSTAYAWFVWDLTKEVDWRVFIVPPCKMKLMKPEDAGVGALI